ncbi:MAG TPA: GAF domain-containing protein [Anaeromyxobacteraceae bacterium]|nr:GAF domain-containing protein [Anaeromyxobacteraceae bacterium]
MVNTPAPLALERRVAALEAEVIHLTERALGAEQRLARAAQLYATASQLHQASDTEEVVTVIKEVVANPLGCEEMGVYDVWPLGPVCTYVDGIGLDADRFGSLPPTHATLRAAIAGGEVLLPADPKAVAVHGLPLTAVVPLRDDQTVCGLVVLFSMLRQKPTIDAGDLDLLEALGRHAGRALGHARLRERLT